MNDYADMDRELGWDDEISNDGNPFEVLPEGDYAFVVESFERGRYNGSDKVPPCNVAALTLVVTDGAKTGKIPVRLFLHTKFEWKLCQFFTAIGQRKHGESARMDWGKVPGSGGVCKVGTRTWIGTDGKEHSGNEVLEFYDPETAPAIGPTTGSGEHAQAPAVGSQSWGSGF